MSTRAPSQPSRITAESLSERLGRGEKVQLVDVRTPGEFRSQRIDGAISIPLDQLKARAGELDRATPIICVCQSGGRSAAAQKELLGLGYVHVSDLVGGMGQWSRQGRPVLTDKNAPWALERQVRLVAGMLVLTGVALGWWVHPGFFGLSAFVGAGLVFAGVTDWCGMGLLLARAPWNR